MRLRKTVGWLVFAGLMVVLALQLPRVIARTYLHLGSSYLTFKKYKKAEQAFLKARRIYDESRASCGLGMTYYQLGRFDDAENAFRRAMSLNRNDVCAHFQSGRMYYVQGKYHDAIAAFKRAAALNSTSGTYVYLGNSHVFAREFEPGIDAYKEAIRLAPRKRLGHYQLGVAYNYLRRYEEAVEAFKQAIKLDPDYEEAHYSLALVYNSMRNRPAAKNQYEILKKINPDKADELFESTAFLQEREKGKEKLYFVPVDGFSNHLLTRLISHYKLKTGIDATATEPLSLALPTIDPGRRQLIAEEVIELMKRSYPKLAADPNVVLIALTDEDMYIRQRTWQFAFSYRTQGRFSVISSARMNPANLGESANEDLLEQRMRKMVLKDIGILYYLFATNNDPKSVLYSDVCGLEDLDNMTEDF
jgi:tetratricopeptide (TPR) repeat protein